METNGYLFKVFSDLVLVFFKVLAESNLINTLFDKTIPGLDKDLLNTELIKIINEVTQEFLQVLEDSIHNKHLINESDLVIINSLLKEVTENCEGADIGVVRGMANGKVLVSNFSEEIRAKIEKGMEDLKALKLQNEEIKAKIVDELGKVRNINSEIKKFLA